MWNEYALYFMTKDDEMKLPYRKIDVEQFRNNSQQISHHLFHTAFRMMKLNFAVWSSSKIVELCCFFLNEQEFEFFNIKFHLKIRF